MPSIAKASAQTTTTYLCGQPRFGRLGRPESPDCRGRGFGGLRSDESGFVSAEFRPDRCGRPGIHARLAYPAKNRLANSVRRPGSPAPPVQPCRAADAGNREVQLKNRGERCAGGSEFLAESMLRSRRRRRLLGATSRKSSDFGRRGCRAAVFPNAVFLAHPAERRSDNPSGCATIFQ